MNPQYKYPFTRTAILWFMAGTLFWVAEFTINVLPEVLIFGSVGVLGTAVPMADWLIKLPIYCLVFVTAGVLPFLFTRIPWKIVEENDLALHSAWSLVFQGLFVGAVIVPRVLDPAKTITTTLMWEGGLLLYTLIIGALVFPVLRKSAVSVRGFLFASAFASFSFIAVFHAIYKGARFLQKTSVFFALVFVIIVMSAAMAAGPGRKRRTIAAIRLIALALLVLLLKISIWAPAMSPGKITFPQNRPNVLLIVLDAVRADHLSCYGYHRKTTPTIDAMAEKGVLFENCMSVSHWTLPSHASMFTGMFPREHLAIGLSPYLGYDYVTLAQLMFRMGYQTVGFSANPYVSGLTSLDRGFEYFSWDGAEKDGRNFNSILNRWNNYLTLKVIPHIARGRSGGGINYDTCPPATKIMTGVAGWFDREFDNEKPFFMFINLMEAHKPYDKPIHKYLNLFFPDRRSFSQALRTNQDPYLYLMGRAPMGNRDFALLEALYDGQIRQMDDQLARLFQMLDQRDLMQNTIVIITSDHGEYFGERGLMAHVLAYGYITTHVPLIINRLPGMPPGTRVKRLAQNIDLMPTILDLIGADWEKWPALRGVSLLELPEYRTGLMEAYPKHLMVGETGNHEAIRRLNGNSVVIQRSGYEYILDTYGTGRLYNVTLDPLEETELSTVEKSIAASMRADSEEALERLDDVSPTGYDNFSTGDREKLRALGY